MEIVIRGKEEEVTALIETIQGKRSHTVEAHIDGENLATAVQKAMNDTFRGISEKKKMTQTESLEEER